MVVRLVSKRADEARRWPVEPGYPKPWPEIHPTEWAALYQLYYPELDSGCISFDVLKDIGEIPEPFDKRIYWRPNLARLGEATGVSDPYGSGYPKVLLHLARLLKLRYGWDHGSDFKPGWMTPGHIRLHPSSAWYMKQIDDRGSDYVPEIASLGRVYARRSIEDVRREVLATNDRWLWNAFVIANVLLVDTVRLGSSGLLRIEGPGDEFDRDGEGRFRFASGFYVRRGKLETTYVELDSPNKRWGSAVGLRLL